MTPSSRSLADATRQPERAHAAACKPSTQRPDTLAEHVDEGTLREYVRMELLVARARVKR